MSAIRWTTSFVSFAALGVLLGMHTDPRSTAIALSALGAAPAASAESTDEYITPFKQVGACDVPVLSEQRAFKGGLTTGEQATVRLDTTANTFRFEVEGNRRIASSARLHIGTISLDSSDCSYVMSGQPAMRVAVNKDGVMFGSIDQGGAVPVRLVAFGNVSNRLADLAGDWRMVGEADIEKAHIRPDGTFSRCSLKDANPMQCIPNTGRIAMVANAFTATDAGGPGGTMIIGKVAGQTVPILLRPQQPTASLRFLLRSDGENVPVPKHPSGELSRKQGQIVLPVFHPGEKAINTLY